MIQSTLTALSRVNSNQSTASKRSGAFCLIYTPYTKLHQILAERKTDDGDPLYLVKWEGYQLHRSTWEPRENFVDTDCLVNWEFHKRDAAEGRAKLFKIAKFDAAVRHDEEQRERRHAKREEKRRQKETRGPTPRRRRRLLSKKELAKKGTARKALAHDASSTPSSAVGDSPKERATPLFELSAPSGSASRKRKRPQSDPRLPSPALSVNSVSSSQYSMFNERTTEPTESPHKFPTSHSTTVTKRARVNDQPGEKEVTKQQSGTSNKGIGIVRRIYTLCVSTTYRGSGLLQKGMLHRVKLNHGPV